MNTRPENIIIDSCQYTPVYLVQDTGAIQGRSYILTQNNVEDPKPVTDNLKRFYENSGILENHLVNNVTTYSKPRILKKQDNKVIGNNLKLASFLLPKTSQENNLNKQCLPVHNVILKPTLITNVVNNVPKVEVDRKIVKLKDFPDALRAPREKILPKIKPKEEFTVQSVQNPIKHTSVQLLKLGETYHSLNQLNDDQMKMVNQALKIFSNPEKASLEPTYDPETNTRFIYKVVSPRDLTVVGKNKIIFKNKRQVIKKEVRKVPGKEVYKPPPTAPPPPPPPLPVLDAFTDDAQEPPVEIKVTRSGRKVKFPKQIVPDETPQKPRKKNGAVVSCFQCSTEFSSLYRLQKHYENHPTHIPAKIHSNLFHCLLAIVKSGSEEDKTNIFIQQLEQLIEKLKSLLPCLLKKIDGSAGKSCTINDDIGRLFGMNPGKYNLNVDALTCVKDKDGNCRHNPQKTMQSNADGTQSQPWLLKHDDESVSIDNETEDCARINAVDKWPTANKRIWNSKQQKSQELNAKRMRLASETAEPVIDLGIEDLVDFTTPSDQSAININPEPVLFLDNIDVDSGSCIQQPLITDNQCNSIVSDNQNKKAKGAHTQFHSTHFDIRSSPIKPSAAIFSKFQINPEKIPHYEVQIIRPLDLDNKQNEVVEESAIPTSTDTPDLQTIFRDEIIELPSCKETVGIPEDLTFDSKDWIIDSDNDKSNESFMKTNNIIEPALLHVKEDAIDKLPLNNLIPTNDQLSNQGVSVLNLFETLGNGCLSYPETEIRNNELESVDFQLDLFSFSNT